MQDLTALKDRLSGFLKENSGKKKLLVINSYNKIWQLGALLASMRGPIGQDTSILCFRARVPRAFNEFYGIVKLSEDYLEDADYANIDNYVVNDISVNWYRQAALERGDIFAYKGIDLGSLAEYSLRPFLMFRIKALKVLFRAMETEKYGAVFIIDSNNELDKIGLLIERAFEAKTEFFKIFEAKPVKGLIKEFAARGISYILDRIAQVVCCRKEEAILIDARLYYQLDPKDKKIFIPVPFEDGLKLRLRCMIENHGYVPLTQHCQKVSLSMQPLYIMLRNRFIFEGLDYWEIVKDKIEDMLRHDFGVFRKNIDILSFVFKNMIVKSLVLRNDSKELEKAAVFSARRHSIPTLIIQHGIMAEPNCGVKIFADKVAVWGDRDVRWYKRYGNDVSKMTITGNANMDLFFGHTSNAKKESIVKLYNLPEKRYLITLISSAAIILKWSSFTTDDLSENLICETIQKVSTIGNANLIVKVHPNERARTFEKLLEGDAKKFTAVVDSANLQDLIAASDLVITKDSTAALGAVVLGKPLVVVNLTRRADLVPYVSCDVAIGAYRQEDVAPAIRAALSDKGARENMVKARDRFLKDFLYAYDGRSRERILKLIESISRKL